MCTHGRHDACCAERGRPVAAALSAAHPEDTWEVSHIGGDRFAGNLLVLPHGLYYGRLDAPSAIAVAGDHEAGQLDLDHLRGRSGYAMPVQAAEIALRRELGETRNDALRLTGRQRSADETTGGVRRGRRGLGGPGPQQPGGADPADLPGHAREPDPGARGPVDHPALSPPVPGCPC